MQAHSLLVGRRTGRKTGGERLEGGGEGRPALTSWGSLHLVRAQELRRN